MTAPAFICFSPNPVAHLPEIETQVLHVLRNARGFYIRHGFTASTVAHLLKRAGHKATPRTVSKAFESLERRGLAESTDDRAIQRYRAVRRG